MTIWGQTSSAIVIKYRTIPLHAVAMFFQWVVWMSKTTALIYFNFFHDEIILNR